MSLGILQKVGEVSAKLITPLWIGGYKASTFSKTLDLVEPIRPYEIKGVLRWMLRILAFSAVYEKTGDLEASQRKAIEFVEKILGKASDGSGRSSIYILRIEKPEGGVLPRDLEIQFNKEKKQVLILRSWWKELYETLRTYEEYDKLLKKSMETIENKCENKNVKAGINIYCCVSSDHQKDFGGKIEGIMLPIPYIDVYLAGDPGQNISQCIDTEEILRSMLNNSVKESVFNSEKKEILKEHQMKILNHIKDKLELEECSLGKNMLRYQLRPPRDTCFKLLSIGDPRTSLSMLGKDIEGRAESVFMIPPGLEVTIGIYRRDFDEERSVLTSNDMSILDDIILRSLSLALVVKGIGKAVNRGYGSFEIIDINKEGHSLKTIYDPCDIKKEIDFIKEHIYKIMPKIHEEVRSFEYPPLSYRGDRIYIGFIAGYYDIFKSMLFEITNIPEAINTMNYVVLRRSHRSVHERCMAVLGLPRKINKKINKRLPSLIRFRIVRCGINKYCILTLYFLTLNNSIIRLRTRRDRTNRGYGQLREYLDRDKINSCVKQIFHNICTMLHVCCYR